MATLAGREIGRCGKCLKKLMLNPENGMCINCENDDLRKQISNLELCLSQCRKEKSQIYSRLIDELKRSAGDMA